ncbi:hypothetical protein LRP67_01330 [Nocardioides sp. cx-169]|uniref:hypothetical protein n=1 Tax=Nocardioides sp. cx-169 TaxID=2899080 RepID=UPI001E637E8A|nr:hypothetical protein [Nocardioides sp. cx-169]MCD4532729.1 hypothetical protein [Nocardioides sp. cx-169]
MDDAPATALPLTFRIGVTAARKVGEQVQLVERRGATGLWAPAPSTEPHRVDDASLPAATREVGGSPAPFAVVQALLVDRDHVDSRRERLATLGTRIVQTVVKRGYRLAVTT